MVQRYGLGWLDLEVSLAADLTFSGFKAIKEEKKEENEKFLFNTWLISQQSYFIRTIFAEKPEPFPSFEEFKAPKGKKKSKTITEEEKERINKETERIQKKFGGGK